MSRMIECQKLGKTAEGLDKPPMPGELGQRVYEHISKEAWGLWLKQQTILINEHHLSPVAPASRKFLAEQMEAFLFGDGITVETGYVEPDKD